MRIDSGLLTNPTSFCYIPPLALFFSSEFTFFHFLLSLSLSFSLLFKPLAPALYCTIYTPIGVLSIISPPLLLVRGLTKRTWLAFHLNSFFLSFFLPSLSFLSLISSLHFISLICIFNFLLFSQRFFFSFGASSFPPPPFTASPPRTLPLSANRCCSILSSVPTRLTPLLYYYSYHYHARK